MTTQVIQGDCLEVLKDFPNNYFDSLVTDPPAGISFMNRPWDHHRGGRDQWVAWLAEVMRECLRVAKPGSHGLVWALPRTSHWTATACEDAGWEIRDRVAHLQGQGFPKAKSALKPSVEDWWLLRKPFKGSAAANVAEWGTGALNIDGTRVGTNEDTSRRPAPVGNTSTPFGHSPAMGGNGSPYGRWPSNVVLSHGEGCVEVGVRKVKGVKGVPQPSLAVNDGVYNFGTGTGRNGDRAEFGWIDPDGTETVPVWECEPGCPVAEVDAQSGISRSTGGQASLGAFRNGHVYGKGRDEREKRDPGLGDVGGASRFYPTFKYTPKASPSERPVGPDGTRHVAVKPLTLMRWLCRLVTPPGGTILDPFAGSGATMEAAMLEGFGCVGIEFEPTYIPLIQDRVRRTREAV